MYATAQLSGLEYLVRLMIHSDDQSSVEKQQISERARTNDGWWGQASAL